MSGLPLPVLLAGFAAAAAVIWFAGSVLSSTTDILDERLRLGSALGGVVLLAVATNLPEIAITVSASLAGNLEVAIGNLLGGIAVQTVVLAALDADRRRASPLTYRAASLVLVLEGALVVVLLLAVIMGAQLGNDARIGSISPASLAIVAIWIAGVAVVARSRTGLAWDRKGDAPGGQPVDRGHAQVMKDASAKREGLSTAGAALRFSAAAVLTLGAGVLLEQSGEAAADRVGMTGVLFGATVLAAATALPEFATGRASMKLGDDQLAVSDIFGGNAFLPVLFIVADLLSGEPVLPALQTSDLYLAALGGTLTMVYVFGLILRPRGRILGMGADSALVVLIYLVGAAGLIAVA